MPMILGIDTGGTFTDGVLIHSPENTILEKNKSRTTGEDLTIGIRNCISKLNLQKYGVIDRISLSTTLATNAVVEGYKSNIGLLLIGRKPDGILPAENVYCLEGLLDIKGRVLCPLNLEQIEAAVHQMRGKVSAVAISGYASVRNPHHELQVKKIVQANIKVPIICAHELSADLGFYERTTTAALNAGLIPVIFELLQATRRVLREYGVDAPIMIVKGDGSLMSEEIALERPIETILSGPAASIIGGLHLSRMDHGIIVDIGGTTTDTAYVRDGKVRLRREGAMVGGWQTQVQAADICTYGIGGDSYLWINRQNEIMVGPTRVIPLCVAGRRYPYLQSELIDRQRTDELEYELFSEMETDCFVFVRRREQEKLSEQDERILSLLEDGAHSLFYLADSLGRDPESLDLSRLVRAGIIARIALTPTDLLHADGRLAIWDVEMAKAGVRILAKRKKISNASFLQAAIFTVQQSLATACLQSVASYEGSPADLIRDKGEQYFLQKFFAPHGHNLLAANLQLKRPIIAIGAPSGAWMDRVCHWFHTNLIVPEHAEVANAVGAAVGRVSRTARVLIRPDSICKKYILHAPWERREFDDLDTAKEYALSKIGEYLSSQEERAGVGRFDVHTDTKDLIIDGSYIETRIVATAEGSPIC